MNSQNTAAASIQREDGSVEFPNVLVLNPALRVAYYNFVRNDNGEVLVRRIALTQIARDDSERLFNILDGLGLLDHPRYVVLANEASGCFDVVNTDDDKAEFTLVEAR